MQRLARAERDCVDLHAALAEAIRMIADAYTRGAQGRTPPDSRPLREVLDRTSQPEHQPYDTPETAEAKAKAASGVLDRLLDGPRRFTDSIGARRVSNQWGFNSFETVEDVERSLRHDSAPRKYQRRRKHTWYIWRLADGTFDFTASATPDVLPGHPAELVKTVEIA